ncbi:MAG: aa3-type cytochrome c oxidase subunit IV [Paracoccus sp. (in: a-proteobacteria)]
MATHHEVAEHKHGEMDTTQQESTFHGFVKLSTWVVIIAFVVLIFMALTNA